MRFYVDECIPPAVADAISATRGHRAVHSTRDLGFGGRDDAFHLAESRRRREILVTSNSRDFGVGFAWLRDHPGVVVLNVGAWTNSEDLTGGVRLALWVLRKHLRIGAKPPFQNTLRERRLVMSSQQIFAENADGERFDVYPRPERLAWYRAPRKHGRKGSLGF